MRVRATTDAPIDTGADTVVVGLFEGKGVPHDLPDGSLQALVDAGEVDVLRSDDGEATYRRCSPQHHHHLLCRSCGHTVEVADPPVERWAAKIAAEHGFQDVQHSLEVFGTCAACAGRN